MSIDRAISVIDAFIAAPRSAGDLVVACRITEDSARRYIAELRARDRLAFAGYLPKGAQQRGAATTIWRWVPPEHEGSTMNREQRRELNPDPDAVFARVRDIPPGQRFKVPNQRFNRETHMVEWCVAGQETEFTAVGCAPTEPMMIVWPVPPLATFDAGA